MVNRRISESLEQEALIKWASHFPRISSHLFHIPNGKQRDKITGAKLKREGVRPGIPDLMLAIPSKHFHGLFIELKRDTKCKPTCKQIEWLKRLQIAGYMATVAYGWEHAKRIIQDYLR